ncbi:MAG: tryptophanase [Bacteroidales bacterium]
MKAEPHKIKTVKNLNITSYAEREIILREAGYNTFNIHSNHVLYDMVSQGTSAKSQEQESGSLVGDETYAGSRNFEKLMVSVKEIFGHDYVCPVHNLNGAVKLVTTTIQPKGAAVFSNASMPENLVTNEKLEFHKIISANEKIYTGNVDIEKLENQLKNSPNTGFIFIDLYAEGYKPVSIECLKNIRQLADRYKTNLVLDVSKIVELSVFIKNTEIQLASQNISDLVKEISSLAHVIIMDASQDARCNIGGLIASNHYETYEKYMNEVVVYEGLHTYGGMSGRTMESFRLGILEMVYEPQAQWIAQQVKFLSDNIKNIPHFIGADGVYIKANEFLQHLNENQASALAALLYQKAGIRCLVEGRFKNETILQVQIPRLGLTNDQVFHIAKAIVEVYQERNAISHFSLLNKPIWHDQAKFSWNNPVLNRFNYECEAYRIQTIEYVGIATKEERKHLASKVGFNTFLLPSKDVMIDFLTDSGTCAQTNQQWSMYNNADETPASSKDYFDMVEALKDVTGYKYIIPTHQGRAAEHIMSQVLIKGGYVPGNMYFTTTKLHQEMAGGTFVDVIIDEAHDAQSTFDWKGNIDIKKIQKILDEHGEGSIPYISFEFSVNLAGGQPVHMDNMKEVYLYCKSHNIPVMFDATRAVENAYMIKKKDPRYLNVSIREILREMFSYGDGCTVSSKKDYLVNIGGFLGIRDDEDFYDKAMNLLRVYEGTATNGGMSAGDMAMHAEGVREMIDFNYIKARVEQTHYLGKKLMEAGIPVVQPIGTHAVFIDAKRFLPHIDQDNFPAQALAAELFIESGIRAMERGNVSSGRNRKTGKNYRPALELVRLTIPRRAYTNSHMELVAEGIINLYKKRDSIKGLEFVYEPENLRFFQGRFKQVE